MKSAILVIICLLLIFIFPDFALVLIGLAAGIFTLSYLEIAGFDKINSI